jgi:hypothetical protein
LLLEADAPVHVPRVSQILVSHILNPASHRPQSIASFLQHCCAFILCYMYYYSLHTVLRLFDESW